MNRNQLRERTFSLCGLTILLAALFCSLAVTSHAQEDLAVVWGQTTVLDDPPVYKDQGLDARHLHAGIFGDEYPRALKLADGSWLLVFTSYAPGDSGYALNPSGGNILVVMRSTDQCRAWSKISTIADPGRDMDNGEMIQLPNGTILMGARSVRWQESYRLPVYESRDNGASWKKISDVDSNEGKPGELGNPDKGVYEPHFYQISPNLLGVMYSTEKHVVESPSYSQTIAEKISTDGGKTWGREIWVASGGALDRPGMPVWTRMKDGRYIVVYEVGGPQDFIVHSKTSRDGMHWTRGLGRSIAFEQGGPYVLRLADGRLLVTSNSRHVAITSGDNGATWKLLDDAFPGIDPNEAFFTSIYQIDSNHIAMFTGLKRPQGGRRIVIRIGRLSNASSAKAAN